MKYVASQHVVLGKPDEHSYNLFLAVMGTFFKLRLWHTPIHQQHLFGMFHRVSDKMRWERIKRKRYAESKVHIN